MVLEADSLMKHSGTMHLLSSSILMRYASRLEADNITLEAGVVHVEGEARLDVTGRGEQTGPGVGGMSSDGYGLGAGHGGYGGGWTNGLLSGMFCHTVFPVHVQ